MSKVTRYMMGLNIFVAGFCLGMAGVAAYSNHWDMVLIDTALALCNLVSYLNLKRSS